jgi:hypothetical protein
LSPYSVVIPGITKASAVGFMMSIVTASIIVTTSPQCAGVSGASSSALTRSRDTSAAFAGGILGSRP